MVLKPSQGGARRAEQAGPVARVGMLVARVRGALALVVREVLKFGVVGGVAFVVDVGLFNLLLHAGDEPVLGGKPLTAGIISTSIAIVIAWLGNRYWTFRHRRRSAVRREVVLFFAMNLIGMGIALACLAVSRYILGFDGVLADNIAKNGVGLLLGMVFRFLAYRYVVFRGDLEKSVKDDLAAEDPPADVAVHAAQRTWTTSPALSDSKP